MQHRQGHVASVRQLLRNSSSNGSGRSGRQASLGTPTGSNSRTAIFGCYEQQRTTVASLAADVPRIQEPVGKFLSHLLRRGAAAEVEVIEKGDSDLKALGGRCRGGGAGGGCIRRVGKVDGSEEGVNLLLATGGQQSIWVADPATAGIWIIWII